MIAVAGGVWWNWNPSPKMSGPIGPGNPAPDPVPPCALKVDQPEAGLRTNAKEVEVHGSVEQGDLRSVWIALGQEEPAEVPVDAGEFRKVLPLPDRDGNVELHVLDKGRGPLVAARWITVDRTPPKIRVSTPEKGMRTAAKVVHVEVRMEEEQAVQVWARAGNGKTVELAHSAAGRWEDDVPLMGQGEQDVVVRARDEAGNESSATIPIERDTQGPKLMLVQPKPDPKTPLVTGMGKPVSVRLSFKERIRAGTVTTKGREETMRIDKDQMAGEVTLDVPQEPGGWYLWWKVEDLFGNRSSGTVTYQVTHPLPAGFLKRFEILDGSRPYHDGKKFEKGEWFATDLPVEVRHKNSGIVMRLIPAGWFRMGASADDPEAPEDERPRHKVIISKPFYLGKHEVTWKEWPKGKVKHKVYLIGHFWELQPKLWTPRRPSDWTNDDFPVVQVPWTDARAFCDNLGLRLPTEAEWEFAARAGSAMRYPWGTDPSKGGDGVNAPLAGGGSRGIAPAGRKVERKNENELGLSDMIGNVWEWCYDWYDSGFYSRSEDTDPKGPAGGTRRVARGGSFILFSRPLCVSTRMALDPSSEENLDTGFRVVADPRDPWDPLR